MKKHLPPTDARNVAPDRPPGRSRLADLIVIIIPVVDSSKGSGPGWMMWLQTLFRLGAAAVALWKVIESTGWL